MAEGPVVVLITSNILMVSFLLKLGLLHLTTQLQPELFSMETNEIFFLVLCGSVGITYTNAGFRLES